MKGGNKYDVIYLHSHHSTEMCKKSKSWCVKKIRVKKGIWSFFSRALMLLIHEMQHLFNKLTLYFEARFEIFSSSLSLPCSSGVHTHTHTHQNDAWKIKDQFDKKTKHVFATLFSSNKHEWMNLIILRLALFSSH